MVALHYLHKVQFKKIKMPDNSLSKEFLRAKAEWEHTAPMMTRSQAGRYNAKMAEYLATRPRDKPPPGAKRQSGFWDW